jgi:hypothetical protein
MYPDVVLMCSWPASSLMASTDDGTLDRDLPSAQIDVGPLQRDDLAAPKPGVSADAGRPVSVPPSLVRPRRTTGCRARRPQRCHPGALPDRRHAALAPAYTPRRPTETVLYSVVREQLETCLHWARETHDKPLRAT